MAGLDEQTLDGVDSDDPICKDLCDLKVPLEEALKNANLPRVQWAMDACWSMSIGYRDVVPESADEFHRRAEALHRVYKAHASGYLVTKLGDPRPNMIFIEGRWVTPNTWQRDHERIGLLIKGNFHCERCALQEKLVSPVAIAIYPCNIFPYSQTCRACGKLIVSGLRQSDGSGDPFNLF